MKVTNHSFRSINTAGTQLLGYMLATRQQIEALFGPPLENGDEDEVTTKWLIGFEDGVVATIYDWKRYEEGPPGMDEVYSWHIGGHLSRDNRQAVLRLHDMLRESLGLIARSA